MLACLRCHADLTETMGVMVFVRPDKLAGRTVESTWQTTEYLLCVEDGGNGRNVIRESELAVLVGALPKPRPLNGRDLIAAFPVIPLSGAIKGYIVVVADDREAIVGTVKTLADSEWTNGHFFSDADAETRLRRALERAARRATERTALHDGIIRYSAGVL